MANTRTAILLFTVCALGLSLFAFRVMLTTPGLVEWTSDFRIHFDISMERTFWINTWHPYVFDTDNAPTLSMSVIYSLFLLSPSSEIAQRLMIVTLYTVMFANMSIIFFLWFRTRFQWSALYMGSLVSAMLYTLNPWVAAESVHWFVLWNYAWAPPLLYLAYSVLESTSRRALLTKSLLLGIVLTVLGTAEGLVLSLVLISLFLLVYAALSFKKLSLRFAIRSVIFMLSAIATTLVLSGYWVVPFLFNYRNLVLSGPTWVQYSGKDLLSISQHLSLTSAMRLQYPLSFSLLSYVLPSSLLDTSTLLSWIVPISGFSAILFAKRDNSIKAILFLAVVFLFLSKGTGAPFGEAYLYLGTQAPLLSNFGWVLFKPAYLYTGLFSLCISLLAGVSSGRLYSSFYQETLMLRALVINQISGLRRKGTTLLRALGKLAIVALVIVAIVLNGAPLMTGDLGGYMHPVQLPSEYSRMNAWLSSQPDNSRVAWLPPSSQVFWSPYQQLNPLLDRTELSPLPVWASAKPVLGLGVTYQFPTRARIFPQLFTYEALNNNMTKDIGKIYSIANVGYLVYHSDVADQSDFRSILPDLLTQSDLQLAFSDGNVSVFRNLDDTPEIGAVNTTMMVLGGIDSMLQMIDIPGYAPQSYPSIFLEQNKPSIQQLQEYSSISDSLLIYGPKSLDDLVLSSIDDGYYVSPQNALTSSSPLSPWDKDFFYSHLWIPARLDQMQGIKYDFDLSRQIVLTSQPGATLQVRFDTITSASYDVWVRTLLSPQGGSMTIETDDQAWSTNTYADGLSGFKWLRLGGADLSVGEHNMDIRSNAGFNAINLIAVVPRQVLLDTEDQVVKILQNVRLMFGTDMNALNDFAGRVDFTEITSTNNVTGWNIGNGEGTFSVDHQDYAEGAASTSFSGTSDSYGGLYAWYVPATLTDMSKADVLRFWIKTDTDIQRFRVYIQDTAHNFEEFFVSVPKGSWKLVSLRLSNYDYRSDIPPNLRAVQAINLGFTGNPETPYNMKFNELYFSNDLRSWKPAILQAGTYDLVVSGEPSNNDAYLRIITSGENITLNFDQVAERSVGPIQVNPNDIIKLSGHHLRDAGLLLYQHSSRSVSTLFGSRVLQPIVWFHEDNPTRWTVSIDTDKPFILTFAEAESPLWVASDNQGHYYQSLTLNSIINGFLISRIGRYELTISYTPQQLFQDGIYLSSFSLPIVATLYFVLDPTPLSAGLAPVLKKIGNTKIRLSRSLRKKA